MRAFMNIKLTIMDFVFLTYSMEEDGCSNQQVISIPTEPHMHIKLMC